MNRVTVYVRSTRVVAIAASVITMLPLNGYLGAAESQCRITDDEQVVEDAVDAAFQPASLVQPAFTPQLGLDPDTPLPAPATEMFGRLSIPRSVLTRVGTNRGTTDYVMGIESVSRVSTDAGNLMGKSPAAVGVTIQRRTPVITDPRIRGSRVGRMFVRGSHWVSARLDLDTMLSKIDSRIIDDVVVIKGPYSVRYGPGFNFTDVQLQSAPRHEGGCGVFGSTSTDYKSNGEQFYGRQSVWGGADNCGYRISYGHRTGNDYTAGDGTSIPASYNSRDWDVALGYNLDDDRQLDFHYLRLDQTGVELAGQAFDIDWLVTDGFEVKYSAENQSFCDLLTFETWYNRTRFDGSAQRDGKRQQFPLYDFIDFVGVTDVDSISTGFRQAATWGHEGCWQFSAGIDLRYIQQELNEITSSSITFPGANSPIPKSEWINPGVFIEYRVPVNDCLTVRTGARGDFLQANVIDDPAKLSMLGTSTPQLSLAEILGTDQFDQDFFAWSAHVAAEYEVNCCWSLDAAAGYAERPPNLTELYAAEPFMFLLQNGLNTITGDPLLAKERLLQCDLGAAYDDGCLRGSVNFFYAWVHDYITYENVDETIGFGGVVEQVNLQYVNTPRASLTGVEARGEYDWNAWLMPFATLAFVDGRDLTRDGRFATREAEPGTPKLKDPTRPRGFYSGTVGGEEEPLPSIPPLESRIGLRLQEPVAQPRWGMELTARMVHGQDRVATSLHESTTPGFTVWDIRTYWRRSDSLLVVTGIENFTNRTYREHFDFRSPSGLQVFQPGSNFYFGGELKY